MTNLRFSNKKFLRTVRAIRKVLPILAVLLLITVYAVSAFAAGALLSSLMTNVTGGVVLAYAIGTAIQFTRAILVFFNQLNPSRPSTSFVGEFIAILMGIIAIAEIVGLVFASNLPIPVAVSLSILMAAGVGVELFLLREIRYATELELFSDREHWNNVVEFQRARAQYEILIEQLEAEVEAYRPELPMGKPVVDNVNRGDNFSVNNTEVNEHENGQPAKK